MCLTLFDYLQPSQGVPLSPIPEVPWGSEAIVDSSSPSEVPWVTEAAIALYSHPEVPLELLVVEVAEAKETSVGTSYVLALVPFRGEDASTGIGIPLTEGSSEALGGI